MSGVIWKNGTPITYFSNFSEFTTEVTFVATGADIYATGTTLDLTTRSKASEANSVYVVKK